MKILAIIPARGGSKGIVKKNIKKLKRSCDLWYRRGAFHEGFEDEIPEK